MKAEQEEKRKAGQQAANPFARMMPDTGNEKTIQNRSSRFFGEAPHKDAGALDW